MKKNNLLLSIILLLFFLLSTSIFATTKDQRIVKKLFNISLSTKITNKEFSKAITTITGVEVKNMNRSTISYVDAILIATTYSGYVEVANTYTEDTINEILKSHNVIVKADKKKRAILALALEIDITDRDSLNINKKLTPENASTILMKVANLKGKGKNYLGDTFSNDIYGKLWKAFNDAKMPKNEYLMKLGNKAIEDKIVTGYGIKDVSRKSNFDDELSLRYGHNNYKHATQLVALLKSHNIHALINVELSSSAYEYLLEWGPIVEPTDSYYIEKINNDFYIAHALGFDIVFEFDSKEDMDKFNEIVLEYAKKSTGGKDISKLIFESWWQPYFNTTTMQGDAYKVIQNNIVSIEGYELHTSSLPEDTTNVQEWLKKNVDKGVKVSYENNWVNNAFFRFLNGESE